MPTPVTRIFSLMCTLIFGHGIGGAVAAAGMRIPVAVEGVIARAPQGAVSAGIAGRNDLSEMAIGGVMTPLL
jgi:hypothetical protein